MKRTSATSGNLVKKADASNGYRLWITASGAVQFEVLFSGTTKTVTSATTIPLNTWKHVTARYNGSKLRVFIDGTTDRAKTTATGSLAATTEALWLGYYDAANHHFHGYLDDVSIYARALSNGEIAKLSNNRAGRYEYHHTNALGSNIIMTDDSKNVDARYEYDVFGAVRSEVGTGDTPRKFTGKEYDSDVKLYYFAARYYDPHIGRFTQRDPAGDGLNWYSYAYNNPLAFIDPTGMYIVLPGGGEIRSVPDLVDGSYVRLRGLTDEGGVVWNSIFTGGANKTGIAGSKTAGGILTHIIESTKPVRIEFADNIPGNAYADATNFGNAFFRVRINESEHPGYPPHVPATHYMATHLVHEFSHIHDFMNIPQDFRYGQPYQFRYVTELKAYDLEARFAREMDRYEGNYRFGSYSAGTNFDEHQLITHYNTTAYYRALNGLARPPGLPY